MPMSKFFPVVPTGLSDLLPSDPAIYRRAIFQDDPADRICPKKTYTNMQSSSWIWYVS